MWCAQKQTGRHILAHNLGTLVTYNAFSHADAEEAEVKALALRKLITCTAGSQIGNPFVIRNLTNGRILPLAVRFWHHLYNLHDRRLHCPIRLWDMPNFRQTDTPFDEPGLADHTAEATSAIARRPRTYGRRSASRRSARGRSARPAASRAAPSASGRRANGRSSSALTNIPIQPTDWKAASTTSS